jgi:hypothetical protein
MDTTKLVVGQDVFIHSGPVWHHEGKVISVAPSGVEVQVLGKRFELLKLTRGAGVKLTGNVVRFDAEGACECGTCECGPWIIDDEVPFAERKSQIEQASREAGAHKQLRRIHFFGKPAKPNAKAEAELRRIFERHGLQF